MGRTIRNNNRSGSQPGFGTWLRHWRKMRGLNQIALAEDAGISTRHLSFLETGRSLPSRDMVTRLTDSLELSNAEGNFLLLAAGYAPAYPEDDPADPEYEAEEKLLEYVLSEQMLFPALVIDQDWNIQMRNTAAASLFAEFRASYRLPEGIADNALHILCHPDGLRQFMLNWAEYVKPFVKEIDHEAARNSGSAAATLRDALHAYPGVPDAAGQSQESSGAVPSLRTLQLQKDNALLSFHTAFTTVTLPSTRMPQHLKIECLYPADRATARIVEGLASIPT